MMRVRNRVCHKCFVTARSKYSNTEILKSTSVTCRQSDPRTGVLSCGMKLAINWWRGVAGENVFLEADGTLKLIDTRDTTLSRLDSLFLPGTFILQRNMLGNDGVFERKPGEPKRQDKS